MKGENNRLYLLHFYFNCFWAEILFIGPSEGSELDSCPSEIVIVFQLFEYSSVKIRFYAYNPLVITANSNRAREHVLLDTVFYQLSKGVI